MIKKKTARTSETVSVTFAVPDEGTAVSVVADFNDWDPYTHPLKRRSNGTRSVTVPLPRGAQVRFRYLDSEGRFFDDTDGAAESNGYGGTHTVLAV